MKKIGFIILAIVLALGLIGAAYALWSQSLSVISKVSTGNLAATIDAQGTINQTGADSDLTSSQTYATIVKDLTHSTPTSLAVTISNAAPGCVFTIPYVVTNTGTVPIDVSLDASGATITNISGTGATIADLTVNPGANPGVISATDGTATGTITITVNDSAPNNVHGNTYTVTVPLTANQKNQ